MTKRKTKERNRQLYSKLLEMGQANNPDLDDDDEGDTQNQNNRMKKFRFQLLHEWLIAALEPCRAADIGGGKGLLTYLLRKSGWDATVIDPVFQDLPHKYKDILTNKRVLLPSDASVPRIDAEFKPSMAAQIDLMIGLHAHGCNIQIIDACATYNAGFVLLPCCVIDEPVYPRRGVTWIQVLTDYAIRQGFIIHPFQLAFSGQNIGIYAAKRNQAPK